MESKSSNRRRRSGARSGGGHSSRPQTNNRRRHGSEGRSRRRHGGHAGGGRNGNRRSGRGRVQPTFDPSQFINKNPVEVKEEVYKPKNTFATFGLTGKLVGTINKMGLTLPTPIQDQIIPEILNDRDVIGLAETGTGKTAAFLIPLIEKTLKKYHRQTLILTPTRELALQIDAELKKLSAGHKIFSTICVGGMNIRPQINGLRRQNHFVIGTPGRIQDLIDRKVFKPQKVTTVVLDEADRMLDMGFINDMRKILFETRSDRETLFFSATMSSDIEALVDDFLNDPITVSVKKKDVTNSIEQDVVPHGHHDKFETLTNLLEDPEFKRVIIFGSMKHSVEKLSKELTTHGVKAESIHGNKSHGQRQRALSNFKSGNARVLVATDVAARGIHVDNVTHVINYDLPTSFEDYVHRIGRTGRGTKRGKALTFVPQK